MTTLLLISNSISPGVAWGADELGTPASVSGTELLKTLDETNSIGEGWLRFRLQTKGDIRLNGCYYWLANSIYISCQCILLRPCLLKSSSSQQEVVSISQRISPINNQES